MRTNLCAVDADVVLVTEYERSFFFVQRASLSFWRFLAGLDFQSSGVSPSLIVSFSSRELCCLGADTIVASMIWPPLAR